MNIFLFAVQEVLADENVQQATATIVNAAAGAADALSGVSASSGGSGHLILLLTVFVLAVFVGVEIIAKIPPTLHTPLMSGSNAISGITVLGAVLSTGAKDSAFVVALGFISIVLATINVVGGFVVTNRMLAMFRTKKK